MSVRIDSDVIAPTALGPRLAPTHAAKVGLCAALLLTAGVGVLLALPAISFGACAALVIHATAGATEDDVP